MGARVAGAEYEPCPECGLPLGKRDFIPRHRCTHALTIAALRKRVAELERAEGAADDADRAQTLAEERTADAESERDAACRRADALAAEIAAVHKRVSEMEGRAQQALGCREKGPRGEGIGHSGTYESVCTSCTERYRKAEQRVAELEGQLTDNPSCLEAEHGGHPTCPHLEEMMSSLSARAEQAGRERDDHERAQDEAEAKAVAFAERLVALQADLDAAHACLIRILGTVRGSNLGYEIEDLLRAAREGEGGKLGHEWSAPCGSLEGTDHCWLCGQPREAH